jgi:hypothetical protein
MLNPTRSTLWLFALLLLTVVACNNNDCKEGNIPERLSGCDSRRWTLESETRIIGANPDSTRLFRKGEFTLTFDEGGRFTLFVKQPNYFWQGPYRLTTGDTLVMVTEESNDPCDTCIVVNPGDPRPYFGPGQNSPTFRYIVRRSTADSLILRQATPQQEAANQRLVYVKY